MTIPVSLHPGDVTPVDPAPPIRVYVAVPSYDGRIHAEVLTAVFNASMERPARLGFVQVQSQSWLCRNFNVLFTSALNLRSKAGITHFLMLHEDVAIQSSDWLSKIISIAEAKKADVLSVISPLKFDKGLTSTALDNGEDRPVRRLTLNELYKDYEPTFTTPDLLINTGLMLVDLRNPIFEDPNNVEALAFTMVDKITTNKDGSFGVDGTPEDWNFSRKMREFGASIWATREIPIIHKGGGVWGNMLAWGSLDRDVLDVPIPLEVAK